MNFKFNNKKITGILSIVPKNTVKFEEEIDNYNFSKKQSMKLKKIMGYGEHRIAKKDTCVSDLCIFGLRYIFNEGLLRKDEIDALILVTSTPDYFMFHQPNKFMLERLADKMEINYDKMPNNIVGKFGNSNGVTIPVNLT